MKKINLIIGKQGSGKTTFAKDATREKLTGLIDCSEYLDEDIVTVVREVPNVQCVVVDGCTLKDATLIYKLSMWLVAIGTDVEFYFIFQVTLKEVPVIFREISFLIIDIDHLNQEVSQLQ